MANHNNTLHLFWGGPFSQWIGSEFELHGVTFNCAEQAMMFAKASLFKDDQAIKDIMNTHRPDQQKAIGRKVMGFNDNDWFEHAQDVVTCANYAKFTQDAKLNKYLLGTSNSWIVEASPYDKIWGIGLSESDPDAQLPSKWQGTNYLGECIMEARDAIVYHQQDVIDAKMEKIKFIFDYGKTVIV